VRITLMLTQKVHSKAGLSLHELQHRVNEECIMNSFSPAHNIKAPITSSGTHPKQRPLRWHTKPHTAAENGAFARYSVLNKVTQVFPMPQGDIHMKQGISADISESNGLISLPDSML